MLPTAATTPAAQNTPAPAPAPEVVKLSEQVTHLAEQNAALLKRVATMEGTNGGRQCRVISGVSVKTAFTSITQAMLGTLMCVVDDSTAADATGTNSIKAGLLEEFISATATVTLSASRRN
jgi:hypothetical protein